MKIGVGVVGVVALVLLWAAPAPRAADDLGRLFSSAEERERLDELRRQAEVRAAQPPAQTREVVKQAPAVDQLTVNGIVLRSSGNDSSWVNGAPLGSGQVSREGIRVETTASGGGRVRVVLPEGLEPIELRPGQRIDVQRREVHDAYETPADASR